MSEIRYDTLHDTHVIIAPERLHRPDCIVKDAQDKEFDSSCPFCEHNEHMTPAEIFAIRDKDSYADEKGWQTRVVPNLYKALQIEAPYEHHTGEFDFWEGFGAHEIIIDTPEHHTSMTQWSERNAKNWLKTLRQRVADLRGDHRIAYISLFKNEGHQAGATQKHSHTQLIGLPIVPKNDRERFYRSYEYYKENAQAMMEAIVLKEIKNKERIVAQSGDFTAYCPYASAYPFEVIISSTKALGQIDTLSDESIATLVPLLLLVLKKLKHQLGCFDFNLSLSSAPLHEGNTDHSYRFAIRIMPRIYRHGGFEVSTGVIINPVAPELAAKLLRESRDV